MCASIHGRCWPVISIRVKFASPMRVFSCRPCFRPPGRTEAFVSGTATAPSIFIPRQRAIRLAQFNCRIENLVVTAQGGLHLPEIANPTATGMRPIAEFIAQNYPHFSRQLASLDDGLAWFDQPQLQIELTPSETRGALVTAVFSARAFHRETPWPMRATELRATARTPLLGQAGAPASLDLSAAEFFLPARANTQAVLAFTYRASSGRTCCGLLHAPSIFLPPPSAAGRSRAPTSSRISRRARCRACKPRSSESSPARRFRCKAQLT